MSLGRSVACRSRGCCVSRLCRSSTRFSSRFEVRVRRRGSVRRFAHARHCGAAPTARPRGFAHVGRIFRYCACAPYRGVAPCAAGAQHALAAALPHGAGREAPPDASFQNRVGPSRVRSGRSTRGRSRAAGGTFIWRCGAAPGLGPRMLGPPPGDPPPRHSRLPGPCAETTPPWRARIPPARAGMSSIRLITVVSVGERS